jgi:hypothetical protein
MAEIRYEYGRPWVPPRGSGGGGGLIADPLTDHQGTISLADAIQNQATTQKQQALGMTTIDPFQQLMQQLQQQLGGVSAQQYMSPLEQLRQQAQSSVSAQYDPQIAALKAEMERTQGRGKRNKGEARSMYSALSKDIASDLPGIKQMMDKSQADVGGMYKGAQAEITKGYDASQAEQESIMKQLGIQAAMPDANKEAATDEQYFKNIAGQDSRQIQDALEQIQQGAQVYNTESSQNANFAGTNAVNDIQAQLEDYLQQAGGQMSALTSGKEAGIAAALAQLQAADQQRAEQQAQQAQAMIMQLANFQLDAQTKLGKLAQGGKNEDLFKGTSGLSGATNFLAQKYPNQPTRASALSSLLGQVLSLPELQSGKQTIKDPSTNMNEQIPVTTEFVMQKIREAGEGQGFAQGDLNNVMDAYLATIGKLR